MSVEIKLLVLTSCLLWAIVPQAFAQQLPPYKNPNLPVEQRVQDLRSRMTPEEKFWQCFMIPGEVKPGEESTHKHGIFGFQVSAAGASGNAAGQMLQYNATEGARELARKINRIQKYFVEQSRLGIPIIAFDEALHGLVRGGATAFPQSIALAATWDTSLMRDVAETIALETRLRGIRQILSPVINLANDVRWGRTEETYGEDPFLSAAMGVAYMGALERNGIVATPKHFLANVGDGGRDSYPIHWSEWYLRQTHLVPFRAAFEKAKARSVMTAYNTIDGQPSTGNNWLLNEWLKKELGFTGFIISDASATGGANVLHMTARDYPQSSQQAMQNGLDVIFQTDYNHHKLFDPPFYDGGINAARIDDAVSRVLRAKFELGLFENPYVDEEEIEKRNNTKAHKAIAAEAARKSIVLLKNEGILPLSGGLKKVAVIGDDAVAARLGGYSGPGNGKVSILEGLQKALTATTAIAYAQGYTRKSTDLITIPARYLSHRADGRQLPGLAGAYFDNMALSGTPVLTRIDEQVNFHWTLFAPDPKLPRDFFAVSWTGLITPDETGIYEVGLEGNDGYRLYLNDSLLINRWEKASYSTHTKPYAFQKGMGYNIRVEFKEPVGNGHIRLVWSNGAANPTKQLRAEAVAAARQADAVVLVAGIHEGEFQDRAMLSLDHGQEELIEAIAATGKPVVVLLVGGSAITMSRWMDKVQAIAMVWYPGEEGGHAVADILTGKESPAGRLPITFPVHEAQLPLSYWHLPTGRGDDYHNLSGEPLFPFGYGLSYTQFTYSDFALQPAIIKPGDTAVLTLTLRNTGNFNSDEVVQLYLRDELASLARPVMELKGFQRVHLKKGESRQLSFTITPDMLEMLTHQMQRIIEPGDFRIMVGASSKDIRWKGVLKVE